MTSLAQRLADLPAEDRAKALEGFSEDEMAALEADWDFWVRPEQRWPADDPAICWFSGGRGSGKTAAGAQVAAAWIKEHPTVDGGIVAPTFQADALRKCVEGESGLLWALGGVGGPYVAAYNRSEGVVYLRSGASVSATGAAQGAPHIQGENLGWLWGDEVGLWARKTWRMTWEESITYAVRKPPARIVLTGTPKAGHPLVKLLEADDQVAKQRLRTIDNVDFLDADWAERIFAKYAGTRLGRQELEGILIEEVEGALWTWRSIEEQRWKGQPPAMRRIVVGVDPSGGASEIGNVAAGLIAPPSP